MANSSSARLYCWFDWEDNTTSVHSANIIREPRKPISDYVPGEKVRANIPSCGLWPGVIVEIGESKEKLERKMKKRQSLKPGDVISDSSDEASSGESDDVGATNSSESSDKGTQESKEGSKAQECRTNAKKGAEVTRKENRVQVKAKKSSEKRKAEVIKEKPKITDLDETAREEKKKKKKLEINKMEAKLKQFDDIIQERRKQQELQGRELQQQQESQQQSNELVEKPIPNNTLISYPQQGQVNQLITSDQNSRTSWSVTTGSDISAHNGFSGIGSGNSAFEPTYSFVGDLRSPLVSHPHSQLSNFQTLFTYQELLEKNRALEEENYNLREQLRNEKSKQRLDVVVTPRKVSFLKELTASLEQSQQIPRIHRPKATRLDFGNLEVRVKSPVIPTKMIENIASPNSTMEDIEEINTGIEERTDSQQLSWEENVTSTGVKKVRLVPDVECYVTQAQLSQALHVGTAPRKLIICLLDILFTKEQLAKSCATGSRKAHNSSFTSTPLPATAVQAIKSFVLNHFKKDNGEACLSDPAFNDVINSKCATARRGLKK